MYNHSRGRYLFVLALVGAPLIGIALARIYLAIDMSLMTRDVNALKCIHPLAGILSSLGILMWWTSASIYIFTVYILGKQGRSADAGFLLYSGFLSIYLGLDDLFQVHEYLAPNYLGLSEHSVYLLLGFAMAYYLYRFNHLLRRADTVLLILAFALLGSSVAIDSVLNPWTWRLKDWEFFVEDGAKWVGICCWTAFCLVRCASALHSLIPTRFVYIELSDQ